MKKIKSESLLHEIDCKPRAIIFIMAEWSIYAVSAFRMIQNIESVSGLINYIYCFDSDIKNKFIFDWLLKKNADLSPAFAVGAGSSIWLERGRFKEFVMNTENLEYNGLKRKFEQFISLA